MDEFRAGDVDKDSDGMLVTAAKRGNARAFEELVLRHEQRVFAVAQRITNNRQDAEDVVQETFHKVFVHLANFQEKSRFSTWLTRIAMNEAFMLLRRRRGIFEILPESADDGVKSAPEAFVDERPNPEESCLRSERTQLLTEAINRLGPRIRTAILLRDIEERSAEEAAHILGTTIGAVKARVFHGRRKLRGTLNPARQREIYTSRPQQAQRWG
ncbi:MAG: polymerase sigma-70 factor, subfamily [Acidobacteriaceae bacterium]|jgi:RNA polymerase sigma-70 factor (ECF subfamily)|nr:polymerase sigma-70 factor, subfamily [Acidobacteriaceae bacterium]